MKTYFFTIIMILLTVQSAMAAFEKGYIVTNQNDTIQGFIKVGAWIASPTTIEFKDREGSVKILGTADIAAFYVSYTQELYVAKTATIEVWQRDIRKMPSYVSIAQYANRNKQMSQITAFVRVLGLGKLNLYVYTPEDAKDYHLLIEKDKILTPLVYHVALVNNVKQEFNTYQNQLKNIIDNTLSSFESIRYDEESIKAIIDKYNTGTSHTHHTQRMALNQFVKVEYGGLLSVFTNTWHNYTNPNMPSVLANATTFSPGVFFNFKIGKRRGIFNILTDVCYYQLNLQTNVIRSRGYDITFQAKQRGLRLFHGIKYLYDFDNWGLFFETGLYSFVPFQRDFTESYTSNGVKNTYKFNHFGLGNALGIGVRIKRLDIGVRVGNKAYAYHPANTDKAFFRANSLVVKYNFNK